MTDLFNPFDLAGLNLANRMVMAPMTRTRADDAGVPTDAMAEYYVQRASAGLIVTECTAVRQDSAGIIHAPGAYNAAQEAGWRKITDGVHAAGGRIYLQIWHGGRISHPSLQPDGAPPIAPSAITASGVIFTANGPLPYETPRALETAEIAPLVESFGAATAHARRAGFDGVELHGAFGYLPDQFLQDGTNQRTDAYGGSVENRARFMLEVTEAMIGAWSAERVGVKLSPSARHYGQSDSDAFTTFDYVARQLSAMKVGYLHVMEPTEEDLKTGTVQIEHTTAALRPAFPGVMISNGGYDKAKAETALAAGTADLVSFGVPFIANPDLPARFQNDAPLNTPDPATFYGSGAKGYTDYPSLSK
ncbi:MAG: alkene reductase [Bradyrhizobium sp.]|nr:alkene reductase [Bradyrhizobium sp.]